MGLNPYCSGQWTSTGDERLTRLEGGSLNPYCSGQWTSTMDTTTMYFARIES